MCSLKYHLAFHSIKTMRIPPRVTKIDMGAFRDCEQLFSIELPENVTQIENYAFSCTYVRNIVIPPKCNTSKYVFISIPILLEEASMGNAFFPFADSRNTAAKALEHRFDGLPIHKICYYHSYHPSEVVLKQHKKVTSPNCRATRILKFIKDFHKSVDAGCRQDCFRMTPLHILACSAKHDLEVYQVLIERYPENLITRDNWGDVPFLYALWGNAPVDVVRLLAKSYQTFYPSHTLEWGKMVETMFDAGAPLFCIQNLLNAQRRTFPNHHVDWQGVVSQLVKNFTNHFHLCSPKIRTIKLESLSFLLKHSIHRRLELLGVEKWEDEINSDLEKFVDKLPYASISVQRHIKTLYSKLSCYEHLKHATTLLELALWKSTLDKQTYTEGMDDPMSRDQCRVNCGAQVILPNVLAFLLPG